MSGASTARLPDFIVIGAMKAATSTVCAYFEDHPDTFMPERCEPNFFSHDENWSRGPDWYAAFFEPGREATLVGEGSNDYANGARYPLSAERMAATCPEARIVYMVRHPVDRIASAWVQLRSRRRDGAPPTVDAAVRDKPEVYVDQSRYWAQLSRFRAHFDDSRIFVGFMEDMQRDQAAFFAHLCDFLGVPVAREIRRPHANPSAGKSLPTPLYSKLRSMGPVRSAARALVPPEMRDWIVRRTLSAPITENPRMSEQVRKRLLDELRPDAQRLLAHCGKPMDFWTLD